ncbi:SDR family NAD(P)-dependent oxidoreductase [Mycobacterium intracellulare]|uniref:SDR family NAD(P)-dependent oxidoreductase n=1 Tax=Mycobacterium intracellulare TaxID=1767 RepID=UPI0005625E33|nr:SDR family oxidoreductase [Mycobacterium intracellulare]
MDERGLAGKCALVTGAGRGIGAAIAERLAEQGAHVIMAARSEDALRERTRALTDRGLLATAVAADVGSGQSVSELMDAAARVSGTLDIVINNAGVLPKARRTEKVTRAEWDAVMSVNLTAPWNISCRAKELMAAANGGVIVNVASTAAYFPSAGLAAYNVSKAALIMLTRVCALEWAAEGIRVVGVAPGKVDTDMVKPILDWTSGKGLQVNPQTVSPTRTRSPTLWPIWLVQQLAT